MNMNNKPYLKLIYGPMFAGKSTTLKKHYESLNNKKKVILVNHANDDRYNTKNITPHDGYAIENCKSYTNLIDLYNDMYDNGYINNVDCVMIDEAQFFNDLILFINSIQNYKINLIVAGLHRDSNHEPFGEILMLESLIKENKYNSYCTDIEKLYKNNCMLCSYHSIFHYSNKIATHTLRISKNKKKILIGSVGLYKGVCEECWTNNK